MSERTPQEQAYITEAIKKCADHMYDHHRQVAMQHDARILFACYLRVLAAFMADLRDANVYTIEQMANMVVAALEMTMNEEKKPPKVIYQNMEKETKQ